MVPVYAISPQLPVVAPVSPNYEPVPLFVNTPCTPMLYSPCSGELTPLPSALPSASPSESFGVMAPTASDQSFSPSCSENVSFTAMSANHSRTPSLSASSLASFVSDSSGHTSEDSNSPGNKQNRIFEVRCQLDALLLRHFNHKVESSITAAYTQDEMQDFDEKRDVLRGVNVANIRTKSVNDLNNLYDFVEQILISDTTVLRVDLVLQKKGKGKVKGLLVFLQFANQEDLCHVRDAIWKGQGFDTLVRKFAPAVFAQDCSWTGLPKGLNWRVDSSGDIRVYRDGRGQFPPQFAALGMEENTRVKSMSVSFKPGRRRKMKTIEVPSNQFLRALSEGKVTVNNKEVTIDSRKTLTISFMEDWKIAFWSTE